MYTLKQRAGLPEGIASGADTGTIELAQEADQAIDSLELSAQCAHGANLRKILYNKL